MIFKTIEGAVTSNKLLKPHAVLIEANKDTVSMESCGYKITVGTDALLKIIERGMK